MKFSSNARKSFILVLYLLIINLVSINIYAVVPFGANVTSIRNETAIPDLPQSVQAIAGNVSELNIFGYSVTQSWQGFFGNVTGSIQLSDGTDNIMYNWSLANPEGEIYSSNSSSISWTNVQCFNYTAKGTFQEDSNQRGSTSLYGLNLSQLENRFNISANDVDGVNETFIMQNHQKFYTNNLEFSEGECMNTKIYNSSGVGIFDEVLLYSPEERSVIFTSIIKDDLIGFDGLSHDFEMMVLEDGHNSDVSTSNYYFYVELQ